MNEAKLLIALSLTLALAAGGCSPLSPAHLSPRSAAAPAASIVTRLSGIVDWGESRRSVQADQNEIASGATVSLIDLETGITVATTVTAPSGSFELAIPSWTPTTGQPYALEAVKGLKAGGTANRVGASAARLRTVISLIGGSWTSLTGPSITIGQGSTAVLVAAGLRNLSVDNLKLLIGKLEGGNFTAAGGVSEADFTSIRTLVGDCLALNQDPVRAISLDSPNRFYRQERLPIITDVSTSSGKAGDQIFIYGNNFDPTGSVNKVAFGGTPASAVEVNSTGTRLTVTVPDNAQAGPLTVSIGGTSAATPVDFAVERAAGGGGVDPAASVVTRLAGSPTGVAGFSPDGTSATSALLDWVGQMVFENDGTLLFVESDNNRLRAYSTSGGIISTRAAGEFRYPTGVAKHPITGEIYMSDTGRSRIVKLGGPGGFTTVAGFTDEGFYNGQGPTSQVRLNAPTYMAFRGDGTLFFIDAASQLIRKLTPDNLVLDVAGTPMTRGFSGDGGPALGAQFWDCCGGIALDQAGNVYVADGGNRRVRKISTDGIITTIAGTGAGGDTGDGGPALEARFGSPAGLAFSSAGELLVADSWFRRVRKIAANGTIGAFVGKFMDPFQPTPDGTPALEAETGAPNQLLFGPDGAFYLSSAWKNWILKVQSAGFLSFNGTGQYVSVPANSSLPTGNSPYTLQARIKPSAVGRFGIVGWGAYGNGNKVNAFRLTDSGGLLNYWWANDFEVNGASLGAAGLNLADGAWHLVTATFDGSERRVYVDGLQLGKDHPTGHDVPSPVTNAQIGLTSAGEYFRGSMDEVSVWNIALSAGDIASYKTNAISPDASGLVLYYKFDEGSGTTALNSATSTGASLDGTLVGGPSRAGI